MSFYVYDKDRFYVGYSTYDNSDTGNFAVDDIFDFASSHNINIPSVAYIEKIDTSDECLFANKIKDVIDDIKSKGAKIIIARYGVRSDKFVSNTNDASNHIGDTGYLFVKNGFMPFNHLCKFEWGIPYIFVDEDSKEIVSLLIQDTLY